MNNKALHKSKKILETEQVIVYDDFMPPEQAELLHLDLVGSDYEYINTNKVARAWRIRDKFPLRGRNLFYFADDKNKPEGDWVYPSNTPMDIFAEQVNNTIPDVKHLVGEGGKDWNSFSATQWIYQQGTGLSLHDDGANVYSGAFTYFLTKEWNLHWGGLLLVLNPETDKLIDKFRSEYGHNKYWRENWNDDEIESLMVQQPGFGHFIFPKFNRIVFIKNNAHHMVTTITDSAGDRTRKSLAGFFHINKV